MLGEAGIGKSRLVQEYRERYCTRSLVAVGACREFGQRPFDPLVDVLSRLDRERVAPLAASTSKEEQVAAILATVEGATSRRMTTIVVEDVHWGQIELLQMLATLSQWAANRRLLLILTCREAEVPPSSPKFKALARLSRETSMLRLEPFGSAELSELMVAALGDLEAIVPPDTFNDVRRRSAGNPLFAEELLRHAVDERRGRDPRRATHALPISLQGVIRERLDRCDKRDRELLGARQSLASVSASISSPACSRWDAMKSSARFPA